VFSFGRKLASQTVNGVVGISRYILERHREAGFFPNAAAAVIGEPISRAVFGTPHAPATPARFGYLGVLSTDKGLDVLADAWQRVKPAGTLAIAGRGKEAYVQGIVPRFPAGTEFRGWVESTSFLREIDYLVVPSVWHEPFGRIVIEAFAQGVPVIGSRIGGIAETVVDGRNGFTFAPNDPAELAAALTRCTALSPEAYRRLAQAARHDVEAYAADEIAARHVAFYRTAIVGSTVLAGARA
jgi:glycosyltransferase involved in cell wall biosynthesis